MARPGKKSGAPRSGQDASGEARNKIKTSIHFDPEVHKLLAIASIDTGQDMSVIVNALVREKFGGWHIRRGGGRAGAPGAGEAANPENPSQEATAGSAGDAPETGNVRSLARKPGAGPIKSGATPEPQSFGVITERSAFMDHDVAIETLAGGEEAA